MIARLTGKSCLGKNADIVDGRHLSEDEVRVLVASEDRPIRFDWENRWLKGEEYAHILERMDRYCEAFSLKRFEPKTHPQSIYNAPESRCRMDYKLLV